MHRAPESRTRFGLEQGGITQRAYASSLNRARAGKPFELTWRDKIYLRAIRNGETMTAIGKRMGLTSATISETLRNASRRFEVKSYRELLEHAEVLKQLEEE